MASRYQTNRFLIEASDEAALRGIVSRLHDENGAPAVLSTRPAPDDGSDCQNSLLECFLAGDGTPRYDDGNAPEGILRMTGNLDAFFQAAGALVADGSAMLFVSVKDETGRLNIEGAAASKGGVRRINFLQQLIREGTVQIGDEHWGADFLPF